MLQKGTICIPTVPVIDADPFWGFVLHDDLAVLISAAEQGGEDLTIAGPGIMSILGDARLDETWYAPSPPASDQRGSSTQTGKWFWRNQPQGAIFTRAIEEGVNQPGTPLALVAIDFDRDDDSDGNPWSVIVADYMVDTGTSVLELADRLAQTGEFTAVMVPVITGGVLSFMLSAYQAYGVDRTATVRFEKAVNILTELNRQTRYSRYTHLITKDADDVWRTYVTANAYDQARYAYLDISETNDEPTVEKIALSYLDASEFQNEEYELEIVPTLLPFQDFQPGDLVRVHTGSGEHDLDESDQKVIAVRIIVDEASKDTSTATREKSLRIVPELSYRDVRGMAGTNSAVGGPGQCCGPRPPLQGQDPTGGTVLFTRQWTYEAGGGTLNSTSGDFPWGDFLDGGTQSAFGSHYGRSIGASSSADAGYFDCAPGQFVRVAGEVARNWFTGTFAQKNYFIDWYTAVGGSFYISTTVLSPAPCSNSVLSAFDFTTVVPATATKFIVRMDEIAVQDNMTVQVIDDDGDPGFVGQTPQPIGQPSEGAPGVSGQYMPIDAVIPHGYLAGDGVHQHSADQIALENEGLPDVANLSQAFNFRWEAVTNGTDVFVWYGTDLVHEYKDYS
jgi:hypothetical protein